MPAWQRFVAHASHVVLYALMFALPLVGWGMLSAARYPIILYGPLQLSPILPHDAVLYAVLRTAHTVLALLLFGTFIAHFSAALMHAALRPKDFSIGSASENMSSTAPIAAPVTKGAATLVRSAFRGNLIRE
jgi:cytochrome b561